MVSTTSAVPDNFTKLQQNFQWQVWEVITRDKNLIKIKKQSFRQANSDKHLRNS